MSSRSRRRERGATAVVVTLVVTFIALPALAISIDIGNIMFERRQLQNGTDAASLSLAQTCAGSAAACDATLTPAGLNSLASANAADGQSQLNTAFGLNGQCARPPKDVTYANMPPCLSATATAAQQEAALKDLGACPPVGSYYTSGAGKDLGYVETYVQTKSTAVDNTILPSTFAKGITGGGTRQTSCARAAWGPGAPASTNVVSLTMSECDWKAQVGTPPSYPPAPSGAWPGYSDTDDRPNWPSVEHAVWSKGNPVAGCDTSSPGGTAPGGFAWLKGQGCSATMTEGWVTTDPGADAECTRAQLESYRGTVIFIPVFDCRAGVAKNPIPSETTEPGYCSSGSGSNVYYHVAGFAPFYLSGWFFGNAADKKLESVKPPTGRYLCSGDDRCLFGWFTTGVIPAGDFVLSTPTDPNYGITIVQPAG